MKFDDFTTEAFEGSMCNRWLFRRPARAWAQCLMAEWQEPEDMATATGELAAIYDREWKRAWRKRAKQRYKDDKYGSITIWLMLLSTVLQLLLKWWLSRRDAVEMSDLCMEAKECAAKHRNRGG